MAVASTENCHPEVFRGISAWNSSRLRDPSAYLGMTPLEVSATCEHAALDRAGEIIHTHRGALSFSDDPLHRPHDPLAQLQHTQPQFKLRQARILRIDFQPPADPRHRLVVAALMLVS